MPPLPPAIESLRPSLVAGAHELAVDLPEAAQDNLLRYLELLERWNGVYNLTAIREPERMVGQHLLDCLAIVPPLRRHLAAMPGAHHPVRIADVGSGGGLPGVVLAIVENGWDVTCIDAVGKKAGFVRQVAAELRLGNLRAEHVRAEHHVPAVGYDVVVSRAFASLADFAAVTRHLMLPSAGTWLAMKGSVPRDEVTCLPSDIAVFHVEPLRVPGLDAQRCLVWMSFRKDGP
jgi:16S rRNA (guanine527-N7)-methyltransferase